MTKFSEIKKFGIRYNDAQKENNKNYEINKISLKLTTYKKAVVLLRLLLVKFQLLFLFLHIGAH